MKKRDIGNYAQHAAIWDWGGHDNTPEHEYWTTYAQPYGQNVLIPMCALGETGAYMARRGFHVTALDITPEMIHEGQKRFSGVEGLRFHVGDIRDFRLDIPPVDFVFLKDLGHLHGMEDVRAAFAAIHAHMRVGGALVIEIGLPDRESSYYPTETFLPVKQVYPGKKVWKEGSTTNDAISKRTCISQTVYIEDENGVQSFDHTFYLQWYEREELLNALHECGFVVAHQYRNREKEAWTPDDGFWIVEAVKTADRKESLYSPCGEFAFHDAEGLVYEDVALKCAAHNPADPADNRVPSYRFDIVVNGTPVGGLSFRVGYNIHYYYCGQIGYWVDEPHRGHGYAAKSCLALLPLMRRHGYTKITVTTDEGNLPSRRTCERIGARLLETVDTPPWTGLYEEGQRRTSIYEWTIPFDPQ